MQDRSAPPPIGAGPAAPASAGAAARPPRLSVIVADRIQEDLMAQRLGPGDALPTEAQLAERYQVSRTVVREAARLLEQRGLVDIRPGRGMVVAALDGSLIAEHYSLMLRMNSAVFGQLMELRQIVEVGITGVAAERRTETDLAELRGSLETAAAHPGDYAICLAEDLRFHALVARASGNPFLAMFMDPVNACLRESYWEATAYMAHQQATQDEHRAIYEAIAAGQADRARRAAKEHLDRVMEQAAELVPGHATEAAELVPDRATGHEEAT